MEMSTDESLQNAFGNLLALNDAVGALLRASPNKDVVETTLAELSALTLDHSAAMKNAMRPG